MKKIEKKRKRPQTYWFAEPLNSLTNESIARELAKDSDVSEMLDLNIGDNRKRKVFQLPSYNLVSLLRAGRLQFGFKFNIYRRQGLYGKVSTWVFGK
jgi:hypothetical protein